MPRIVLALGLAWTAWAWRTLVDQEAAYQASRLEAALAQTREGLEHRIEEQTRLLARNGVLMALRPSARHTPLRVGGQRWELVAGFVPERRASREDRLRLVALGGVLAFALTLFLAQARRRSEALAHRLQESEARFRPVAETASCAIFIYSDTMEYMNAAGKRMSGYAMAEILGQPLWKLVRPISGCPWQRSHRWPRPSADGH